MTANRLDHRIRRMPSEVFDTLPPNVGRVLSGFVEDARHTFAEDLRAVVLYGSAVDGQLRPMSDVNTLLVLSQFEQGKADQFSEPLRLAQTAIRLRTMFLLESEVRPAMASFAVKFGDIIRRHRVLFGADPFANLSITRSDSIVRLKQTLLNLALRLREAYVARGLREEQLVRVIADSAGPLRSCAATLLELEGVVAPSPKEALRQAAGLLPEGDVHADDVWRISEAREKQVLPAGVPRTTLFHLIELTHSLWARAENLT